MAEKDRIRNHQINIRLSESEYEKVIEKASYCNLSMSDYIRKQIEDGVIVKYESFDIKNLSYELNKIGININQIARNINEKGGNYDSQDMEEIKNEFENMRSAIYKIIYGID